MIRVPARRLATAVVVVALATAGCGGEDEETSARPAVDPVPAGLEGQTEATAALERFLAALVADDGATACALMSTRGVSIVEEGSLIGSPAGGGPCAEVVVDSFGRPGAGVSDDLRVVAAERSADGSLRLSWENAESPVIGAPTIAVLRKEEGTWRLDTTGMP